MLNTFDNNLAMTYISIICLYAIGQTGCINGWQTISDTRSSGATQQFGINTVSGCQQNCINDADCRAVDFINNQCWMHTNAENVNLKIRTIGATQYVRCAQAGEFQNTNSINIITVHQLLHVIYRHNSEHLRCFCRGWMIVVDNMKIK